MGFVSTKAFAATKGVKAESILARLCRFGSYYGARPEKQENGRLNWYAAVYAEEIPKLKGKAR
jgi:hypothetical protein